MNRNGFTLAEVLIVMGLFALVATGMIRGILTVNELNYRSAQRVAAFGICRERFERMKSLEFGQLTTTNDLFATSAVRLTHLGGRTGVAMTGTCSAVLVDLPDPVRKHITISVTWRFQGRDSTESVSGVIFDKGS